MKASSTEWRRFERLVTLIERLMVPQGAVVKSPDRLRDADGSMREVDASIRYRVGTMPVLITIECRRRGSRQQKDWLEQLASKRDAITAGEGVPVSTIVVSSSGLSTTAIKAARRLGIQVRHVADVQIESLREWFPDPKMLLTQRQPLLEKATIIVEHVDPADSQASLVSTAMDKPLFSLERDAVPSVSVLNIVDQSLKQNPGIMERASPGRTPFECHIDLSGSPLWVETSRGRRRVREVRVGLIAAVEVQDCPLGPIVEYRSETETIAQHAQFRFTLADGRPAALAFSRELSTGLTRLGFEFGEQVPPTP